MKQIVQNLKTGAVEVADVPAPVVQRGRLLVRAAASLISAGTERAVVDTGRKSLLKRAVEQPELVRKVLRQTLAEGLLSTFNAVRMKLESSTALGYSAAGTVIACGEEVSEFRVGDRVACAGVGYAAHAEVLSVPKNLCVRLPPGVGFDEAAYSTLGAIALQGVRLSAPTLGEAVVVVGLGLLGQLAVQLLAANGCRVFGVDLDAQKVELARRLGAEDGGAPDDETKRRISEWTRGRGADAVLITAATSSNQPVVLAGEVARMKGRVVVVGLVGMEVPRDLYYRKELSLQISMSYGPGRYDPEYEERGHDYPFAYVRWTEGRNLEAFLDLIAARRIDVRALTTHRFPVAQGERAYQLITGAGAEPYLGVVLEYDTEREIEPRVTLRESTSGERAQATGGGERDVRVGLVGAGGYAKGMLLPNLKTAGAEFQSIATASGVTAFDVGRQYDFRFAVSGAEEVFADPSVNLVVIATRHDTHAPLAERGLRAGKHVFVEKPLAISDAELDGVVEAARASGEARLMVGFNRRFSPLAQRARQFFEGRTAPLSITYRVNAGRIPPEHWAHREREGGGRIVSEVCHFIDLMQFWTESRVVRVYAEAIASRDQQIFDEDSVMITLRFADGSNGSIAYLAEGSPALAKERVEIFAEQSTFILEDFQQATLYREGRVERIKLRAQDKGQLAQAHAVCQVVREGAPAPIALEDLVATTRATFRLRDSLRTGQALEV